MSQLEAELTLGSNIFLLSHEAPGLGFVPESPSDYGKCIFPSGDRNREGFKEKSVKENVKSLLIVNSV